MRSLNSGLGLQPGGLMGQRQMVESHQIISVGVSGRSVASGVSPFSDMIFSTKIRRKNIHILGERKPQAHTTPELVFLFV